jgi:hypothetical protein
MVGFVKGPRGSDMDEDVSLGEVYRLCLEIRRHQETHVARLDALEKAQERLKVYGFVGLVALGIIIEWAKKKLGIA